MTRRFISSILRKEGPSVELLMLRAGAMILAVTSLLWQFESFFRSIPPEEYFTHWFPLTSLLILILESILLVAGYFSHNRKFLTIVLRIPFFTILIFLLIVGSYADVGHHPMGNALWFTPFSGLSLAAIAMTLPLRVSLTAMAAVPGAVAMVNSWLLDHTYWLDMLADVGFNLVNTFPFVVFAGVARPVAKLIDDNYANTRIVAEKAEVMRLRGEETSRFTAFVHDYVLAALSAISKGTKVRFSLDERTGTFFNPDEYVPALRFGNAIKARILTMAEDTKVNLIVSETETPIFFPPEVANTIMLAVSEVAKNSAKHAAEATERRCRVEICAGKVAIHFHDNGPGFDVNATDSSSAGLRLSIRGRMRSLVGGTSSVQSNVGQGTDVYLNWNGDTSRRVAQERLSPPPQVTSLYQMMGMSIVFSWQFYAATIAVLVVVSASTRQLYSIIGVIVLILTFIVLGLLMLGQYDRLPLGLSIAVFGGTIALIIIGQFQYIPTLTIWSYLWHISIASLIAALLAIRGRPILAVGIVIIGTICTEIMHRLGWGSNHDIVGIDILVRSVMVVAGVLVSIMVYFLFERAPRSIEEYNKALFDAGIAQEYEANRTSNYRWLEGQVGPIFSAVAMLEKPTPLMQKRARLMEMKLRDVLRSPRLNNDALHFSVWDARSRGVVVKLLDDRQHSPIDNDVSDVRRLEIVDDDSAVDKLMPEMLRTLDSTESGTITIRLLPPGRRAFASISDNDGVRRFNADGERI